MGAPAPTVTKAPRVETNAALCVGIACLLQQVPRAQSDSMFELLGLYIGGVCAEGAESGGKEAAEGLRLSDLSGDILELLGLPREHMAEFVPQSLLELWP